MVGTDIERVAEKGFSKEVTVKVNDKKLTMGGFGGRVGQAEETTCAKALETLRPEQGEQECGGEGSGV